MSSIIIAIHLYNHTFRSAPAISEQGASVKIIADLYLIGTTRCRSPGCDPQIDQLNSQRDLSEFISTALKVSIRYTNKTKGEAGDIQKHADILNTIKSRNPEKARNAVKAILDEALELIEANL